MSGTNSEYLLFKIDNNIVWRRKGSQSDEWLNKKIQLPPGIYEVI